jgi:ATP-dependent Clp protease ATP-binding subunit ClpC
MNAYNFTDRVRKVLRFAREESERLHHEYVGEEHILLGLLREGEGVAAAVLRDLQVQPDALRTRLEATLPPGKPGSRIGRDLPYTSYGKHALESAMAEARTLGYNYVCTEHLLLGVLSTPSRSLAAVLAESGLTLDQARASALRLRGADGLAVGGWAPPFSQQPASAWLPSRAERSARLALLLAVIGLVTALVALALALRAQP